MTSIKPFGTVPTGAEQQPIPFELHVEEQKLQDLKTLLRLSPVAKPTYENLQDDGSHGRFGVSRKWVANAKKYWEDEYDWYVYNGVP
jgi:microsomal epoxide hydrolase